MKNVDALHGNKYELAAGILTLVTFVSTLEELHAKAAIDSVTGEIGIEARKLYAAMGDKDNKAAWPQVAGAWLRDYLEKAQ